MYMPLMINIRKLIIFGGERGEGLQKTQKFAVFADEILVVPEDVNSENIQRDDRGFFIQLRAGRQSEVREKLSLPADRRIEVYPESASSRVIRKLLRKQGRSASLLSSDLEKREHNLQINSWCMRHNQLCNIIDVKELCNTWLTSIIDTPSLQVSINSKGRCAYYTVEARKKLTPIVEEMAPMADLLADIRSRIPVGMSKYQTLKSIHKNPDFQKAFKNNDGTTIDTIVEETIAHGR